MNDTEGNTHLCIHNNLLNCLLPHQHIHLKEKEREGSSSVLVGNPSRDGVSIKTLVWRHLKPSPHLL